MELLTIVDKNDKVIGYKKRDELTSNDIVRASALWVVNSKNQVLLAQRAFNKKRDPGKWGPAVVGTVAKDESYEDNIYKESLEELGIEARGFIKHKNVFISVDAPYFCQWYICTLEQYARDFKIQTEEVAEVAWFDMKELFEDIKISPDKYTKSAYIWQELFSEI